jgi:hypothetical protein
MPNSDFVPLLNATRRDTPFSHFVAMQAFTPTVADAAVAWLDGCVPWRRHLTDFYDQFECSLLNMRLPPLLHDGLVAPATLQRLRQRIEQIFGVALADVFTVTGHRLVPGQGIGVHTDRPLPGYETYRMVVHLGAGNSDANGGQLMFLHGKELADFACAFRGVHNTAVGFELSDRAFHAVAELAAGVRYTLVYSFWRGDCADGILESGVRIEDLTRAQSGPVVDRQAPHAASGRALDALIEPLVLAGAASTPQPESAILPDLVQTYELLRTWHRSDAVCLAGLFHGVYGTAGSPRRLIPLRQRERVREVIGEQAEQLVYACCAATEDTLQQALLHGDPRLVVDRWHQAPLDIDLETLTAIATLIMAHRRAMHSRTRPSDPAWANEKRLFALARPHLDTRVLEALGRVYGDEASADPGA